MRRDPFKKRVVAASNDDGVQSGCRQRYRDDGGDEGCCDIAHSFWLQFVGTPGGGSRVRMLNRSVTKLCNCE